MKRFILQYTSIFSPVSVNDYAGGMHRTKQFLFTTMASLYGLLLAAAAMYRWITSPLSPGIVHFLLIVGALLLLVAVIRCTTYIEIGAAVFLVLMILSFGVELYSADGIMGTPVIILLFPVVVVPLQRCCKALAWVIAGFLLSILSFILHYYNLIPYAGYTTAELLPVVLFYPVFSAVVLFVECIHHSCFVSIADKKQREHTQHSRIQLDLAEKIQRSLIPAEDISFDECDIAFYYKAAYGVGGDYLDYFTIDSERIGLVMCDVAGKGVPAALLMVSIRALLKGLIAEGIRSRPDDRFTKQNDQRRLR